MLEQIDLRDGRDGYAHYRYRDDRDGAIFTVRVEHAADRILLDEVAREKFKQRGISTWSYILLFVNERISGGVETHAERLDSACEV
jgi:hypothetical protein